MLARLVLVCAAIGLLYSAAWAGRVDVPPGTGTLQAAIDAAPEGTTLVLRGGGTYSGAVSVTKPNLTIKCAVGTGGGCAIDAECKSPVALTITASGVKLDGVKNARFAYQPRRFFPLLGVFGGTDRAIVVSGSSHVSLLKVTARAFCGTEQAVIDVAASDHLTLNSISIEGGPTASTPFVRLANIPAQARVVLKHVVTTASVLHRGSVVIQDSGGPLLGSGIFLLDVSPGNLDYLPTDLQLSSAGGTRLLNSTACPLLRLHST